MYCMSYEIRHCMLSVAILCTTGQQCPVTKATIVSSSSSDDICAVTLVYHRSTGVSQETLRYTCTNGVTLTESDNDNTTCLNSTLTFTGAVADLEQLNGAVLTCDDGTGLTDNVTIVIPGESIIRLQTIRYVIDSILLTVLE